MNNSKWFVRRESDDRILCTDGLWRLNCGYIESIKFYSTVGRAIAYGLGKSEGTAYAVLSGDRVDCCGNITIEN